MAEVSALLEPNVPRCQNAGFMRPVHEQKKKKGNAAVLVAVDTDI